MTDRPNTTVDFGQNVFTGAEYWMEMAVRGGRQRGPIHSHVRGYRRVPSSNARNRTVKVVP